MGRYNKELTKKIKAITVCNLDDDLKKEIIYEVKRLNEVELMRIQLSKELRIQEKKAEELDEQLEILKDDLENAESAAEDAALSIATYKAELERYKDAKNVIEGLETRIKKLLSEISDKVSTIYRISDEVNNLAKSESHYKAVVIEQRETIDRLNKQIQNLSSLLHTQAHPH